MKREEANKKRNRSGTSSDATLSGIRKKARQETNSALPNPASYKDATLTHLRVAIIDKDNSLGKIADDGKVLVKRALMEELDKTILSPKFIKNFRLSGNSLF